MNKPLVRLVGILILFTGCQNSLPTAPSGLATGVVVYEHANFLGASAHITADISDLRGFKGPCEHGSYDPYGGAPTHDWSDCISSVRVAPGWSATLYRDDTYTDDSITVTSDVPNLTTVGHNCPERGLNDCVTSIRVWRR